MSFSMLRLLKLLSSGRPGYAVEILNERHQKEWFCNSFLQKIADLEVFLWVMKSRRDPCIDNGRNLSAT